MRTRAEELHDLAGREEGEDGTSGGGLGNMYRAYVKQIANEDLLVGHEELNRGLCNNLEGVRRGPAGEGGFSKGRGNKRKMDKSIAVY